MALSGTFLADFASFTDACAKAEVSLKGFESGSAKVESQLNRMADSFSGRKIIQDATLMATVFKDGGGAAGFTTAQLARMGAVGEEAFEKLRKTGQPVPETLRAMVKATREAGDESLATMPKVSGLHGAFQKFDGVLASLGINIAPEIKGLADLGVASGTTAVEIGGVATAGLVVGAAIGGWKIGRAVADFFDLDKIIGDATAKLLGWGDAAAEAAGAKADALARASKLAGVEIKDLGLAMAINSVNLQQWKDNATISAEATAKWRGEIAKVRDAGDLPALTADLQSQNFTLKDLATRYGVSVEAIQVFTRDTAAAAAADKAASDAIHANNERKLKDVKAEMDAHQAARDLQARIQVELTKLDEQYTVTALERSGTRSEIEIANIHAHFNVLRDRLKAAGEYNAEVAAKIERDEAQAIDGVGVKFEEFKAFSIRNLQDVADKAQKTFEQAALYSGGMTREGIEHFRQLRDEAVARLHETDAEHAAVFTHMRDEVDRNSFTFRAWLANAATDAEKAELGYDAMGRAIHKVGDETQRAMELTGKWYDLQGRKVTSVASDITSDNYRTLGYGGYEGLFREGYSLQEAIAIAAGAPKGSPHGPRVPGFQEGVQDYAGGWAMVGEKGPEAMYVPPHASIVPAGRTIGGASVTNVFNLYGTPASLAAQVEAIVTRKVLQGMKLS